jgi:hypothetical protein
MNKEETLAYIFEALMVNGTVSEKADILGFDPMEQKVYTKRLRIGKDVDSIEVVYVSVTSDEEDFEGVSISDLRINTKNAYDTWVNMFASEADEKILTKIYEAVRVV